MIHKRIEKAIEKAYEIRPQFVNMLCHLIPVSMGGAAGIVCDRFMRLYFDPDHIDNLELMCISGRILVQIEHFYRRHSTRQKDFPDAIWGYASEMAVTSSFKIEGLMLPDNTLYPEYFDFLDGLLAEEYARRLLLLCEKRKALLFELKDMFGDSSQFGSSTLENSQEWEYPEDDPSVAAIDYLNALLDEKEERCEESIPGILPGNSKRDSTTNRQSKVPWKSQFQGLLGTLTSTRAGSSDYSYLMDDPDAGVHGSNLIMPGMVDREISIAIVLDTSGSMNNKRTSQGVAEVFEIVKIYAPLGNVYLYAVDAIVQSRRQIFVGSQLNLIGGGGTDMIKGILAASMAQPRPDVIVVVTDCDTEWPSEPPLGIPVIVVSIDGYREPPSWVRAAFRIRV